MTIPDNRSITQQERIAAIVHAELSPLLTDALGPEHSWDAAEGVASAIIEALELDKTTQD